MKKINLMLMGILIAPIMALGMVFVQPAQPVLALTGTETTGIGGGANAAKSTDQKSNLFASDGTGIFNVITNAALFLIGAISVIMLIYGGIRYTISGGDSSNVTAAKNTILYAIVGVIVALLAYAIVNFVITKL